MKKPIALTPGWKFFLAALLCSLPGFSVSLSAAEVVLIPGGFTNLPAGSPNWHYRLGTNEASTPIDAWRTNAFVEDATWRTGALPIGYSTGTADPEGYETSLVTTVPGSGTLNYLSVFLRKTFMVTNRAAFTALTLGLAVDDGAVVWLNGREVMRFQCCTSGGDPSIPTYDSAATTANEVAHRTNTFLTDVTGPLMDGTNVLCIELFNADTASPDLVVDAVLTATLDDVPPTVSSRSPAAGAKVRELTSIQVHFSEPVANVDTSDLFINGAPATDLFAASPSIYTWQFAQPGTGTVSITFAPGHGITDLSSPPNAFAGDSWTYTLETNVIIPQFFITEFLASNSGNGTNALRDENGDDSDWIEIYNSQSAAGNIGGWFLTDTTNNLTKWRFPNGATVPGRGYLVVFASGKNRTNVVGRLHTNFQLNRGGQYLGLLDPQTNVVSDFYPAYPPQETDISYGRDLVNPNLAGYYTVPTPGNNNVISGAGFGPEVNFSVESGTFVGSFGLTLSVDDSNSVIRYTIVTNAQNFGTATNVPTAGSTLYTGPITITNTVQVRARAFKTNGSFFPGPPRTESYVLLGAGVSNFVSTLPIVVLHTVGATTISGGLPTLDNSVIIECFDNDGGTSSLTRTPQLVTRAGINIRGSSTGGNPKSSFAIELWDEFNDDEKKSFLGLPEESDWVLFAPNSFDIIGLHNPIMHQVGRDLGYYSSRTRFVEVFFRNGSGAVTANFTATGGAMGDYYGLMVLEEKVKRDNNRVDIDGLEPEQTNSPAITGGYLLTIDRTDANERTFSGGNVTMNYQDPKGPEMVSAARAPQAAYIKAVFDNMNLGITGNALTNIASTNHYSHHLDIDGTIDLNIANVLVMNVDGYRLSGYITKPRGGKIIFGPLWDVDRGLGTSRGDLRAFNPRAWQAWDPLGGADYGTDFFAGTTPPFWLGRWFADVDFWQRWVDRYQTWRTSVLDSNRVAAMVDGFGEEIRPVQPRDQRRWGGNGASDANPRSGIVNAGGNAYTHNFPGTFQGEVDFQKRWLTDHIHFMDTNLLNRPAFNTAEGQVPSGTILTLIDRSGKAGTAIYYTLDGSDPRGFQGTTNPVAARYTAPITVTNNVRVRARALNSSHRNLTGTSGPGSHNPVVSTPWSGDVAATYFITPPPLVITELMYHPAPPASMTDTNDADNFEYVELRNIGSTTLNLVGFRFTNGIDFTFAATSGVTTLAAGGYVLVVKNIAAFTNRYGPRTNIAGVYNGNLDNGGERITLVGPRLEPILDFVYSDDWHPLSDGFGFSLIIQNENAPLNTWDEKTSWRLSSGENGSPGVVDPPPPNLPVILVNEALTHTDFPQVDTIELFNPGTGSVNISGWFLTDEADTPKKYQIPANTTVGARGFIQFNEAQFDSGTNAFGLGSTGDEIYLFSATNGLLTGYAHGFAFGAAQNGVSFGRYVNSQGAEHFVAQAANTLGASNSLPRVGPIVISEIIYHPPDVLSSGSVADDPLGEFIELYNITATNVALFDTLHASNTWKLTSAVDFDFPPNTTLGSSNFLLVVNFNPATNASQLAAFRTKFGVAPAIPILGPYGGKLDNSAESVRLRRPDNPNTNGSVPYILVDQIDYEDQGPWSRAADGAGASLQRLAARSYGNDPTNWAAARPSPGAAFQGGTLPSIAQQPANATVFVGGTTNFTVVVNGAGASVQWRLNGDPIPGATNTTLTLANIQYAQGGFYDLVAFNSGGVVFSSNAQLSLLTPVTFSVHPFNQSVLPGTNVTLVSAAFSSSPIRYQWQYEGTDIPGATNASYSFNNASLDFGHGNFRVIAVDERSSAVSSNASIFVLIKPVVVTQPVGVTNLQWQTATFSVIATGAPPLNYRWLRQGVNFLSNAPSTLVISNLQPSLAGSFRVTVTNLAGTVNSVSVNLGVIADADADGVPDFWESNYFGNPTNTVAAADPDGDGMPNRDEYIAGTDPTNALSVLKFTLSTTNKALLEFVTQTNIGYTVQYRTNLNSVLWNNVTSISAQSLMQTVRVTAPYPPPETRFYRIVTPPEP